MISWEKIASDVEQLLLPEEGLGFSDIVVLAGSCELCETLQSLRGKWPGIRIHRIEDFKGQESEFVICVIGSEGERFDPKTLYVGMTRAKKGLKIFMSQPMLKLAKEYLETMRKGR